MANTLSSSLPLLSLLLLSYCSLGRGGSTSEFDESVRYSRKVQMDPEVIRSSEALHSYLVGELRYGKEDYKSALKDFARARELIDIPVVHSRLSELYLQNGEIEKALTEAKAAKDALPDDSDTLALYAGILDISGKSDDAEASYEELIKNDANSIDAYVLLADLLERSGKGDKVVSVLKRLEDAHGNKPVAAYYLGRAYERRGDIGSAERFFFSAYTSEPSRVTTQMELIRFLLKNNKIEKAKEVVQKILSQDPSNIGVKRIQGLLSTPAPLAQEVLSQLDGLEGKNDSPVDTRYRIALVDLERQNIAGAVRELSLVLAKEPHFADAHFYLGSILVGTGKKKEGIAELLKITTTDKLFVKSRSLAALILRQEKKFDEAALAIKEALKEEPHNRQLVDYLIVVLREGKKFEEAEKILRGALDRTPDDSKLLFAYAGVLFDERKRSQSEEVMEQVIKLNPNNAEALNFVAYSLAETGRDLEKATSYVNKAIEIEPDNAYFLDTLAWIYFQKGDLAKAQETIEKAVQATPDDMTFLEHYAEIIEKSGDIDKTIAILKKAVNKEPNEKDSEEQESRERIQNKLNKLLESKKK